MFQVRIHGRGGQGVVTAAEMLSIAAFLGGQARAGLSRVSAPSAPARRWWPSVASTTSEIRLREPIMEPDALIIQDPTLLHQVDVFAGLKTGRLHADQHQHAASRNSGSASSSKGFARTAVHRAGDRAGAASTSAGRCPTCRCSAASLRRVGDHHARIRHHGDPTTSSPARSPTATSPPRTEAYEIGRATEAHEEAAHA